MSNDVIAIFNGNDKIWHRRMRRLQPNGKRTSCHSLGISDAREAGSVRIWRCILTLSYGMAFRTIGKREGQPQPLSPGSPAWEYIGSRKAVAAAAPRNVCALLSHFLAMM